MSLSRIGNDENLAGRAKTKNTTYKWKEIAFTVSNLGMFGFQEFNSIINQPNSAIYQ
jgi:pyruvate dehydrogenase E2 component (dihydrolipoamide acetyltransferase)